MLLNGLIKIPLITIADLSHNLTPGYVIHMLRHVTSRHTTSHLLLYLNLYLKGPFTSSKWGYSNSPLSNTHYCRHVTLRHTISRSTHVVSHHVMSHHVKSHHITSHHITSHMLAYLKLYSKRGHTTLLLALLAVEI